METPLFFLFCFVISKWFIRNCWSRLMKRPLFLDRWNGYIIKFFLCLLSRASGILEQSDLLDLELLLYDGTGIHEPTRGLNVLLSPPTVQRVRTPAGRRCGQLVSHGHGRKGPSRPGWLVSLFAFLRYYHFHCSPRSSWTSGTSRQFHCCLIDLRVKRHG